jgi:hypothetical protein
VNVYEDDDLRIKHIIEELLNFLQMFYQHMLFSIHHCFIIVAENLLNILKKSIKQIVFILYKFH